jgi:hypothetical protein
MPPEQLQRIAPRLSTSDLLAIFHTNPSRATERYAELYRNLVRYFEWNRKPDAEDLAQETLKRGFSRLQQGQKITTKDPAGYFFGIAIYCGKSGAPASTMNLMLTICRHRQHYSISWIRPSSWFFSGSASGIYRKKN